jgi:hypothetical protein
MSVYLQTKHNGGKLDRKVLAHFIRRSMFNKQSPPPGTSLVTEVFYFSLGRGSCSSYEQLATDDTRAATGPCHLHLLVPSVCSYSSPILTNMKPVCKFSFNLPVSYFIKMHSVFLVATYGQTDRQTYVHNKIVCSYNNKLRESIK